MELRKAAYVSPLPDHQLTMGFFDFLSLFYAFLGVRALWTLAKNWRAFTDDQLTPFDRQLASQLAFFVLIPIGVFFHELGHAAATYQVGGTVDWLHGGFHYALFYGYIIPEGRFTALQGWWISLAGNLVSVVFGLVPLLFLGLTKKAWYKSTILTFARFQLGWALIGYPLITFAGFEGDWTTIYFTSPLLGIPVFVGQVALVAALWLADRSVWLRRWEVSLSAGAGDQLKAFDRAIAGQNAVPGKVNATIARGNFFAAHNQFDLAIADYKTALEIDPQNPRALYNIGQMRLAQSRYGEAEKNFRGALSRAESDPQLAGRAHYGLALCIMHHGGAAKALPEFDQAIARVSDVPEFYYWRGTARRAAHDDANARSDFMRAAELASVVNPALAAKAREMIK